MTPKAYEIAGHDRDREGLLWAACGAAIVLFAVATFTTADTDLWGHLRFGLDMLQTHTLASVDPYSFTQDRPWINHEWMSEIVMALAYKAAGSPGLALLKGAVVSWMLLLVWRALEGTELGARIIVFAAVAASSAPLTRTLRPQLWSALFLAILCRVLVEDRPVGRRLLPLLFAIWANFHGGWVVGLGTLGAWAAGKVLSDPRQFGSWALVVLSSAVFTMATPYGWHLWQFLWTTVGMSRQITEWQPLWSADAPHWVPWIAATALSIWALRRPSRDRWPMAAAAAILAYASLRVVRVWPLYVECAAMLLSSQIRDRWPVRKSITGDKRAGVGIFLAGAASAAAILSISLRCVDATGSWVPDSAAARALDGATPGRLVVFFDWGEYALWHWGPQLRVSMDGRRETVYSDARLTEHQAILDGSAAGVSALDAWRAEYVWLPATSLRTKQWLASHGYRVEVETAQSFVAVRSDLPHLPVPLEKADARRCFPD